MTSDKETAEDNPRGFPTSNRSSWLITVNPINERISRSPVPGQPRAKLEKERRKKPLTSSLSLGRKRVEAPKELYISPLSSNTPIN